MTSSYLYPTANPSPSLPSLHKLRYPHSRSTPPPSGSHVSAGRKTYQQDRPLFYHHPETSISLFAVADGHGTPTDGHIVSNHIHENLIDFLAERNLFHDIHSSCAPDRLCDAVAELDIACLAVTSRARVYAGSTLCLVLWDRLRGVGLVGNVGDSRAVLVTHNGVRPLTRDHVPEAKGEKERIEENGGWVVGGALNGYICMSRALGDEDLKGHRNKTSFGGDTQGMTFGERLFVGDAEVTRLDMTEEVLGLVVATDGVWGKMSNEGVGQVVRAGVNRGYGVGDLATLLVKKALGKGSKDNCSVVLGLLGVEEGWEGSDGSPKDITRIARVGLRGFRQNRWSGFRWREKLRGKRKTVQAEKDSESSVKLVGF